MSNYQIFISTSGLNIPADKRRADWGDIRFTNFLGNTMFNYWLETSTGYWVKVTDLPSGTTQIYVYYGNPTATSISSGSATFDFYDDFNSPILNPAWTFIPSGRPGDSYSLVGGKIRITGSPQMGHNPVTILGRIAEPGDYIVEVLMTGTWSDNHENAGIYIGDGTPGAAGNRVVGQIMYITPGEPPTAVWIEKREDGTRWPSDPATIAVRFPPPAFPADILMRLIKSGTNFTPQARVGNTWITGTTISYTKSVSTNGIVINDDDNAETFTVDFDDFRVRKFASPEPSVVSVADEETVYYTSGTYFSPVKNIPLVYGTTITKIIWSYELVSGTTLSLDIRSSLGFFTVLSDTPPWSNLVITTSPYTLQHPGGRYHQYRVDFKAPGTVTPLLKSVTIHYILPGISLLEPLNKSITNQTRPNFKWSSEWLYHRIYISSHSDFSVGIVSEPIKTEYIPEIPLLAGATYFWKVAILDKPGGEEQLVSPTYSVIVSSIFIVSVDDKFLSSFIYELDKPMKPIKINKIPFDASPIAHATQDFLVGNPLSAGVPGYDVYEVDFSTEWLKLPFTIRFSFPDADEDGFVDKTNMRFQHIRIFHYHYIDNKWKPLETKVESGGSGRKTISSQVQEVIKEINYFTVFGYESPREPIEGLIVFPNPINLSRGEKFTIRYSLREDSDVTLRVYNLIGDLVYEKVYPRGTEGGKKYPPPNTIPWDGTDLYGKKVPTGVYILQLLCKSPAGEKKIHTKIGVKK